jgi:hypothetical protein
MKTQTDPKNARSITTVAGGEVDTYFGCWIDNNQPGQTFLPGGPPAAQAQWDGAWTGTKSISSLINAAPHQCLIAEIRYDDTPIPNGANSGTSDKIAQRNIAWIDGPNPGTVESRVMAHPFEVAATSKYSLDHDELVIDWGNTPVGAKAEIYLPALSAADIVALADRRYAFHELKVSESYAPDTHTVQCPAHGITYVPLPAGTGRYAGVISVTLPPGVKRGDRYDIVVRQLTGRHAEVPVPVPVPQSGILTAAARRCGKGNDLRGVSWRQADGAFQFALVIKTKQQILFPEERLLAWLRWRIGETEASNRWYDVLRRYELIVAGRVRGFGGDPSKIPPSANGDVPGHRPGHRDHDRHWTGKVVAITYDRFGDFESFTLQTLEGTERTFRGREPGVEALVNRAWIERFTITVVVDEGSRWPETITLRQAH